MEPLDIPSGAVVVGLDGSHHSDQALDWAARHAIAESRELVLLHAVFGTSSAAVWMASGGVDPSPYLNDSDVAGQAILDIALAKVGPARPSGTVHTVLTRLDPRNALLEASTSASTVVVGSRGRGPVRSLLLGSVGAALAAHASCPVVVVRPHHPGKVRRGVLVGADGSPGSLPVLEFAFRQAAEQGLPLTVAHVIWDALAVASDPAQLGPQDPDFEQAALALAESLAGLGEKFPEVPVKRTLVRGTAATGLLAMADTMDLVVVGHQRRDPFSRAVQRSVALSVLEHAAAPVAVVPQD